MIICVSKMAGWEHVESNLPSGWTLDPASPGVRFYEPQTKVNFVFNNLYSTTWQNESSQLLRLGVHLLLTFFTSNWGSWTLAQKTASLATWPLMLSNSAPEEWAGHSIQAQVALDIPNIRESQGTYQADLRNFRHSGDHLTPAGLPSVGRFSPLFNLLAVSAGWRPLRDGKVPARSLHNPLSGPRAPSELLLIVKFVLWFPSRGLSYSSFLMPTATPRTSNQSAFWAPRLEGSFSHSRPGHSSQRAGPRVWSCFLILSHFQTSQAHLHVL